MKQFVGYIFVLLVVLMGCTTDAERTRMRSELDSINVLNRTDQPFTVQDVEPYVSFFDQHGTANDRLLAHYLLGRAYYEQGEAPMALQCYHDAVECADTLSSDCDYAQLARVYGQMAEIFYYQGLYRQQLNFEDLSVKFAWMGKDTLLALMNYEQEYLVYSKLDITDSAIMVIEDVAQKYKQYGKPSNSAIALGLAIKPLIEKGDFLKAETFMNVYESMSGLFDQHGNIESGREIYYRVKGLYYLYTNKLDSAEFYFRKELRYGKDYNNQDAGAKGLSQVYQIRHQWDSVAKYSIYAYAMRDSMNSKKATKEVERMQAMFDYTRHQEEARKEKEIASQEKAKRQLSIAILLLVVIVAAFVINKMYRDRKKKQAEYVRNLELLEQTQSEVLQLREHAEEYEELIAVKEKLLEELSARLQEQRRKSLTDNAAIDKQLQETDIYRQLEASRQNGTKLTIEELRESRKLVLENLPDFSSMLMSKEYKMSQKDFDLCVLFRLGFKSKEVSNMLGLTQGRVSQICTKILRDVFKKDEGGAAELINILHEWC